MCLFDNDDLLVLSTEIEAALGNTPGYYYTIIMNNAGYELQLYSSPKSFQRFFLSFEAKTLTVFVL